MGIQELLTFQVQLSQSPPQIVGKEKGYFSGSTNWHNVNHFLCFTTFLLRPQEEQHLDHEAHTHWTGFLPGASGWWWLLMLQAAAGSAEWAHLSLSQKDSPRLGLEQGTLDRKGINNLPFSLWTMTSQLQGAQLCAPLMSGSVSGCVCTLCRCFIHGRHPFVTRW